MSSQRKLTLDEYFFVIVNLPKYIWFKLLPYITKLPIFEDFWTNNLGHHKNIKIFKLIDYLEITKKKGKSKVYFVDIDQYHVTYYLRYTKPLTLAKAKQKITLATKKFFKKSPNGLTFKPASKNTLQVLIPLELLRGQN